MKYVMKLLWLEGYIHVSSTPLDLPAYLKSYDPWAFGGRGSVSVTHRIEDAMIFASPIEAHELWKISTGLRSDGKPNRPLTAFTVEVSTISE